MINYILLNLICIIFINLVLYLSINLNQLFLYIILTFFFMLLSLILRKIIKLESLINSRKDKKDQDISSESADEHPIIKSARKRLGK